MVSMETGSPLNVIDPVPVELDTVEFLQTLKGRTRTMNSELDTLVEEARSILEPKAVYSYARVADLSDDQVRLDNGHALRSIVLADILQTGQELAPYVITVGPKLEERAREAKNLLRAYMLEKIADHALEKASDYLRSEAGRLGPIISAFSPGSGTGELFTIEQQEILFSILEPAKNVGVHLSSSYMMVPRKSVSGIFAATREEYVSCAYCPRKCESRRRPYQGNYQHSRTISNH
ncbi:MAG: vitamin B12 dependent-methionine synthase activation domain-containing protein [Candidatus Bathyarchaeia archaeon]|jgi:hypothetical protein